MVPATEAAEIPEVIQNETGYKFTLVIMLNTMYSKEPFDTGRVARQVAHPVFPRTLPQM